MEGARTEITEDNEWNRQSQDEMLNTEGKRFLDLCEEYGLTVLNGRMKGDTEGKFTYIGHRGASVLDYLIIEESEENLPISKMSSVGVREKSDHLPLEVEFRSETKEYKRVSSKKKEEQWTWKEEKGEEFQAKLLEK